MGVSGIGGVGGAGAYGDGSITLQKLDQDLAQIQNDINNNAPYSATQADIKNFISDAQGWLNVGNNSSKFPQFTSWVTFYNPKGTDMSNPLEALTNGTGSTQQAGLNALITELAGGEPNVPNDGLSPGS